MLFRRIAHSFPVLVLLSGGHGGRPDGRAGSHVQVRRGPRLGHRGRPRQEGQGRPVPRTQGLHGRRGRQDPENHQPAVRRRTRRPASRSSWTAAAACASATRASRPGASATGCSARSNSRSDDASLFSFDTRLLTLREFTGSVEHVRTGLEEIWMPGARRRSTTPSPAHRPSSPIAHATAARSSCSPTARTTGAATRRRKWRGSPARSTCPSTCSRWATA